MYEVITELPDFFFEVHYYFFLKENVRNIRLTWFNFEKHALHAKSRVQDLLQIINASDQWKIWATKLLRARAFKLAKKHFQAVSYKIQDQKVFRRL